MAEQVEQTRTVTPAQEVTETTHVVQDPDGQAAAVVPVDQAPPSTVAQRVVWLIASIIIGLLALRFLLSLLGANRDNAFASLIYTLSYPFAAPFFGLFGGTPQYGRSRFEFETLVAMLVYALIAALVARIVTLRNRRVEG